jgi:hypothetical protein
LRLLQRLLLRLPLNLQLAQVVGGALAPSFDDKSEENSARKAVLELFVRLPLTDPLKPYTAILATLSRCVIAVDNEVNGVLAMKVLTQTHKALRGGLEAEAHALLLLLSDFHKSLPSVVSHLLNGGLDCEKLSERVNAGLPSQSVRCPKLQAAFGGALTAVENGSIPKAAPLPDLNAPGVLAGTRLLAARYSFKVLLEAANAVVACATNYQSASQSFNATLSACIDAMLRSMLFISLPDVISLARGHLPSVASVPSMASHVEHSIFEPGNADMGKFKALRNGEFNALLAKHLWWAVTYARLGSTTVLKRYESVLSTGIIRLVSTTALICAYACVISCNVFVCS